MSQISDKTAAIQAQLDRVNQRLDVQDASITGITGDVAELKRIIEAGVTAGDLTALDEALVKVTAIADRIDSNATKLAELDDSTPPATQP